MFIFATVIAYHVKIKTQASEYEYDLEIKGQSQILKTATLLIIQTPFWCVDRVCSNLAHQLSMMCRQKMKISES